MTKLQQTCHDNDDTESTLADCRLEYLENMNNCTFSLFSLKIVYFHYDNKTDSMLNLETYV